MILNGKITGPEIESRWIYYSNETPSRRAEFRKSFNIDDVSDNNLVQLLGDTYAKLFINGDYVGEVHARRSLSLRISVS